MSVYTFQSVKRKSSNAGRARGKGAYLLLFRNSDISAITRDEKNVKITAFDMIGNAKPVGIYHTASTQNVYHASTGEDDAKGLIHNVDFEVPGTELEFDEFVENNINEDLIAISVPLDGSDCKVAGTKASPLKFDQDNTEDSVKKHGHSIKLKNLYPGEVLGHIAKSLIPVTGDSTVDNSLGLGSGSTGGGI